MIWWPLIHEYFHSPLKVMARVVIPFAIVILAGLAGFSGVALIALLVFAVTTGAAINIVKLRLSGMFKRIIVSEHPNHDLFMGFAGSFFIIYAVQFTPSILAGMYSGGGIVFPFALLTIALCAVIGTLIGLASRTLGGVHLFAVIATVPLVFLGMTRHPINALFPMGYLTGEIILSPIGIIPLCITGIFSGLLVLYASRL